MKKIAVLFLLLSAVACAPRGTSALLAEAESRLAEAPDKALAILDGIQPQQLRTDREKAEYALLSARALEANYGIVNVSDEENLASAAAFFDRKGPAERQMQAWYYLGKVQQVASEPNKAIVSFSKAERVARKRGSDGYLGRISLAIADIYASSFSPTLAAAKQYQAYEAFSRAGDLSAGLGALLAYGNSFSQSERFDDAQTVYQSVLSQAHTAGDTLSEVRSLQAMAALALEKPEQDPDFAIEMLGRVADNLHYNLSSEDMGVLAYAYSLKGFRGYSDYWLRKCAVAAETPAQRANYHFRRYQICTRTKRTEEALASLEAVTEYANRYENQVVRQAAVASQLAFLSEQEALEAGRVRTSRMSLWALVLLFAGIAVSLLWYAKARKMQNERALAEEQAETERYMQLAEDLQARMNQMNEKGRAAPVPGLDVLERLCEQYYVYEGTDNLQPKVMKEVRSIVDGLRSDPKVQKDFEASLDAAEDGVMTRIRAAFPSWKEEDFRLYAFAAAGFSSTTMSILLEKEKPYIYNKVYRLKGRIASSDVADKDFFLQKLEK